MKASERIAQIVEYREGKYTTGPDAGTPCRRNGVNHVKILSVQ